MPTQPILRESLVRATHIVIMDLLSRDDVIYPYSVVIEGHDAIVHEPHNGQFTVTIKLPYDPSQPHLIDIKISGKIP